MVISGQVRHVQSRKSWPAPKIPRWDCNRRGVSVDYKQIRLLMGDWPLESYAHIQNDADQLQEL